MFVGLLAVFVCCGRVMLGLLVLANFMMMGGLVMMVRGRVVVSRCLMMMLAGRMLRRLGHVVFLLKGLFWGGMSSQRSTQGPCRNDKTTDSKFR